MPLDNLTFQTATIDKILRVPPAKMIDLPKPIIVDGQTVTRMPAGELIEAFLTAHAAAANLEKLKTAIKDVIMADHDKATIGNRVVALMPTAAFAGKLVTKEMVGTYVGARSGSEKLTVA